MRSGGKGWSRGLTVASDARVARRALANRKPRGPYRTASGGTRGDCAVLPVPGPAQPAYAYLLGAYLGDGYIASYRGKHDFRLFLDARQPAVVDRCLRAIRSVNPFHPVGQRTKDGMIVLRAYGNCWLKLLPQHGLGRKHLRRIALENWQEEIVRSAALEFIAGLLDTDGSRYVRRAGRYEYPSYSLFNKSTDILNLFCWACDLAAIHYTRATRHQVSIARRGDVARLDLKAGPKY